MDIRAQEIVRRRFTVHDYHRMGEAGILHEDDRVELIERHTDPSADGYRTLERARRGETIESGARPELAFPVDAVLG